MKKWLIAAGTLVVIGAILSAAASSQDKSKQRLQQAVEAAANTPTTAADVPTTTASAETLQQKLDRFFAQDPNLAGIDAAARACAEKDLAGSLTTYELDNLLAASHSDSNYQMAISGAKLTASGCQLQVDATSTTAAPTTSHAAKIQFDVRGATPASVGSFTTTGPWQVVWSMSTGSPEMGPQAPQCDFLASAVNASGATIGPSIIGSGEIVHGAQAFTDLGKVTVKVDQFDCFNPDNTNTFHPTWHIQVID